MADDNTTKPKPAIPAWQRATSSGENSESLPAPTDEKKPASTTDLTEQARIFLNDETVKNSTRERKEEFLKSKGLQGDDIQKLLDSEEATTTDKDDELRTVHDSNTTPVQQPISSTPTLTPSHPTSAPTEARVVPRTDVPPIITYPEFLLKPQKPPPLVTLERLANAAYVLAGLSALTYGASKYLVGPMLESLTGARLDLAGSAQTSLQKFNDKLESSVSHVPYIAPLHKPKHPDDASETSSVDSDPTELFHRDIATQTTPARSRSSSAASDTSPQNATEKQSTRLYSLHSTLSSLLSSTSTTFATDNLSTSITDLQAIVDKIEANSHPITAPTTFNNYTGTSWQTSASTKDKKDGQDKEKETEAAKFKAEIRALKGAFLSSRNFPTATRTAQPFVLPQR